MAPPPKAAAPAANPRSPSPRKKPHCTQCGQPMLGHKRGQCAPASGPSAKSTTSNELINRMGSLNIVVDGPQAIPVAPPKSRPASGPSKNRSRPRTRAEARVQQWVDENGPPSPTSSEATEQTDQEQETEQEDQAPLSENPPSETSKDSSVIEIARPIGRTNSSVERARFLKHLVAKSKTPAASIFTINMADIEELKVNAAKLKLEARVIAPKFEDGTVGDDGWLVIGKESHSVDELFEQVKRDLKKPGGTGLVRHLGSGVLGAVAVWTYLAYS